MQEGEAGKKLWHDALLTSIKECKRLPNESEMFRPFVPPMVHGQTWQNGDSEENANNIDFWRFNPDEKWHGYDGYGEYQYFVDPNKFLLTTPGINAENGDYTEFGIPATILANYLREHGIIPEKNDLNSILFLMTPAEDDAKMNNLITQILKFENLVKEDAPLNKVLPRLIVRIGGRYEGYTIRQLCQELHDFYKDTNTKDYQKRLFLAEYFPEQAMTPYDANVELLRNNAKLVKLSEIEGRIALEGALPYPPGVFCVVPGERSSKIAQRYFQILEEGINNFPGFAPEIQGVYFQEENGQTVTYGYVFDQETKDKNESERGK